MPIEISKFLSRNDCKKLIKMIDANHARSCVVENDQMSAVSDERTSSTCCLDPKDPTVNKLHNKIASYLKIDIRKGEGLQGQLYKEGEYFKKHNDFFSGSGYESHCLKSGNRTHTLMIYLNDDFEGGGTHFTKQDITIKPETGKAVTWANMQDGKFLDDCMHEGTPVTKGSKYIITSWWRENIWDAAGDVELYKQMEEEQKKQQSCNSHAIKPLSEDGGFAKNKFSNEEELPKLTNMGFTVVKCPSLVWGLINDSYQLLKPSLKNEEFDGKENVIFDGGSNIMSLEHLPTIKRILHDELLELHESWCKQRLTPSAIYGIRSYNKTARLVVHKDRVRTHHVSSIIIVDKDLGNENKDWPLDIQSHDGSWHKVYTEPGDIILYESAVCAHGRNEHFSGEYFRNFYVHYLLKDWEFVE